MKISTYPYNYFTNSFLNKHKSLVFLTLTMYTTQLCLHYVKHSLYVT